MTEQMRQAMQERHTVRQFDGTPLTAEEKSTLKTRVDELNKTYDLDIVLIESEKSPLSFLGKTLMSGKKVHSYFVLAGEDRTDIDEQLGYAGSDLCLYAQATALNKQNFTITGKGNMVTLTYKSGPMSGIDKGIIKHHFELGAGKENFEWA